MRLIIGLAAALAIGAGVSDGCGDGTKAAAPPRALVSPSLSALPVSRAAHMLTLATSVGLEIFDFRTKRQRLLLRLHSRGTSLGITAASWSPDGRRLAIGTEHEVGSGVRTAPDNRVEVYELDGGHLRRRRIVDVGIPAVEGVGWSPDGRLVTYGARSDVWVMPWNVGRPRVLVRDADQPAWAPDGRRLLIHRASLTGDALLVIDLATRRSEKVSDQASRGSWSPDSRRVAFASMKAGGVRFCPGDSPCVTNGQLFIWSGATHADSRRTFENADDYEPLWSPDGRTIAFTRSYIDTVRRSGTALWDVRTSRLRRLAVRGTLMAWGPG